MTLTADDCIAAEYAIHHTYLAHANDALDKCIAGAVPFTAETVRAFIPAGVEPHHPSVIGAIFKAAKAAGRIKAIGWTSTTRATRHGNPIRIWTVGASQ